MAPLKCKHSDDLSFLVVPQCGLSKFYGRLLNMSEEISGWRVQHTKYQSGIVSYSHGWNLTLVIISVAKIRIYYFCVAGNDCLVSKFSLVISDHFSSYLQELYIIKLTGFIDQSVVL